MTSIVGSGGEVDIVNFIGNHECSKTPASIVNENGTLRAAGIKASLVKSPERSDRYKRCSKSATT